MDLQSLRLPKLVETEPEGATLLQHLVDHARPIREDSKVLVPEANFDNIKEALQHVHLSGHVVRGLETAERSLAAQERGLRMADEKSGEERKGRVSRLALLANDGSDGFYRQVETLLQRHNPRVLAVRLNINADGLGAPLFGAGSKTRFLLINHKEAVAEILLSVAAQFGDKDVRKG